MGIELTHYLTDSKQKMIMAMLNCLFNIVKLGHRKITLILNSLSGTDYLEQLLFDKILESDSAIALIVGCLPDYGYLVKCRHALGLRQYFNFEV